MVEGTLGAAELLSFREGEREAALTSITLNHITSWCGKERRGTSGKLSRKRPNTARSRGRYQIQYPLGVSLRQKVSGLIRLG